MKNEKLFSEVTDSSVNTRIIINEQYHPIMSKLRKVFELATYKSSKIFKILNDFKYYKGGYPKEDSLPKIEVFLHTFGNIFQLYDFLGDGKEISEFLENNYGIKIELISSMDLEEPVELMKPKKFKKLWNQVFNEEYNNQDKKEILEKLLEVGQETQAIICKLADEIKVDNAQEIENKCEIKKSIFMPIVSLKTNYVRHGDEKVFEKINQINEDNKVFNEAINKVIEEK